MFGDGKAIVGKVGQSKFLLPAKPFLTNLLINSL